MLGSHFYLRSVFIRLANFLDILCKMLPVHGLIIKYCGCVMNYVLQTLLSDGYKKLHSLQSLVRTNHRTKTANITKDDVTSASHRQKVTVLQK